MRKGNLLLTLALGALIQAGCMAQSPMNYTYQKGSSEGIGKWYMGREIAHVMGHEGISWLERSSRDREENVTLLLNNLKVQKGETIADIGAGSGYHSEKLAAFTGPAGKVYAVDIQAEMLEYMRHRFRKNGLNQIEVKEGKADGTGLPAHTVDKMLLVDVYHEFENPREMGKSMFDALKAGGRLFLIEYRTEDPEVPIKKLHKMAAAQAILELEAIGFKFVENINNLPWQHCLVFAKP